MAEVAEILMEDYVARLEDDVIPALDDMGEDLDPYVSPSRLHDIRRAVEIIEDFKNYLTDLVQMAHV